MKKIYRKLTAIVLVLCIVLSGLPMAYAAEPASATQIEPTPMPLTASEKETLSAFLEEIPVFITVLDCSDEIERQNIQDEISHSLRAAVAHRIEALDTLSIPNNAVSSAEKEISIGEISITDNNYTVTEITLADKAELLENPLYFNTLRRAEELIADGIAVNHINFYPSGVPTTSRSTASVASSGVDTTTYWEEKCDDFGTYNGYKFLKFDSSIAVTTSEVTPGNISSCASINWQALLQKAIESFVTETLKKGTSMPSSVVLSFASETLSAIFGSITTPFSVTYGSASDSYIKVWGEGDLYTRDVYIRDDLDRMPGYAYYLWGELEQVRMQRCVKIKYPTGKLSSNTYNYLIKYATGSRLTRSVKNYYGTSSMYSSIISLYTNTAGYFTYIDRIDIKSYAASIIL